jgi:hypothetical protein
MSEITKFEFNQDIAFQLFESEEQFPVDFDIAWQWLGYSRKDVAKRQLKKFKKGCDFSTDEWSCPIHGGSKEIIKLSYDCFKMLAMLAETEQGDNVRRYFLNCEKIAKAAVKENRRLLLLAQDLKNQIKKLLPFANTSKYLVGDTMLPISEIVDLHGMHLPRARLQGLNRRLANSIRSAGYKIEVGRSRYSKGRTNLYPAYHPLVVDAVREAYRDSRTDVSS